MGREAAFSFRLALAEGVNAVQLAIDRTHAGSREVGTPVRLVLRPDLEWRSFHATTKALSLQADVYYIAVQSTNASKGGCAYYNVELNTADCSGLPDAPIKEIADASDALALDMPGYTAGTPENMVASAALALGQIVQDEQNSGWFAVGSLA